MMIGRLGEFLNEDGDAFLSMFLMERNGMPLICETINSRLGDRKAEFTRLHAESSRFSELVDAYKLEMPDQADQIAEWAHDITKGDGAQFTLNSYVIHVSKCIDQRDNMVFRCYDGKKYPGGMFGDSPGDMINRVREVLV